MKNAVRSGSHTYIHTYGYLLIIATITAVFAALTTIGVSAVEFNTNYYEYDGEEGVTITGFYGLNYGEKVTIPATIEGKKVLAIGLDGVVTTTRVPGAEKIGALDLNQVKVILPYAFYGYWKLTSLNAPNLTKVGDHAFYACIGLTSFNAPKVTTVGYSAFDSCTGLTSFSAPNLTKVGKWAFNHCTALTSVTLKNGCDINLYSTFYRAGAKDCTVTYVNNKGDIVDTVKLFELYK